MAHTKPSGLHVIKDHPVSHDEITRGFACHVKPWRSASYFRELGEAQAR